MDERRSRNGLMVLAALILVVGALLPAPLLAQGTSDLNGRVLDQQGAVMPGVNLTLKNQESGLFRESISSENGTFTFRGMLPGVYQVTAELPGFKKYQISNVRLEVGRTATLDVSLEVGQVTDEIMVTSEAPQVDVSSVEVGGSIGTQQLTDLPTANRNFTGLLSLIPGTLPDNPRTNFGADAVAVAGQATSNTSYSLDGSSDNDSVRGGQSGPQARIPLEVIGELQLIVGASDAEFGGSGATLNAVSKQGTNQFHGSALTLIRDYRLTKKDFFTELNGLPKPDTKEWQFGGSLGGPIVRNKAHFFANVERVYLDRSNIVNVPGRPDLFESGVATARVWNTFFRFDHQINAANTWGLRWLREKTTQLGGGQAPLIAQGSENDRDQSWVFTWNSVLSPTTVNILRVSYTAEDILESNENFKACNRIQACVKPTLSYLNYTDQQDAGASQTNDHLHLINDSISWFIPDAMGSHNMKAGAEFVYTGNRNRNQGNMNGTYTFSHNLKFDPNNPSTYPERFSIRVPRDSDYTAIRRGYAAYFQDKWKVTRNLTLNVGLRYSYEDVPVSEFWNPKFPDPGKYPKDKNDFGPRLGFNQAINGGKTAIRGSWGLFHQSSPFNTVNNYTRTGVYTNSFTSSFPRTGVDPGPASGNFPTDPTLAWVRTNGLGTINRAYIESLYPQGTLTKNTGSVSWDDPARRNPYNHQLTVGFQHQFTTNLAATVDFQRTMSRDFIVLKDLNEGVRATTARTAAVVRPDPTITTLLTPIHAGYQNWNGLLVSVDKRIANRYSYKIAYTLAKGTGNVVSNSAAVVSQVGGNLNLDQNFGINNGDRRHILALSGAVDVPHTKGMRLSTITRIQSGSPFSLTDDTFDLDRNGQVNEFLPAGTYTGVAPTIGGQVRNDLAMTVDYKGGRNGAYGPGRVSMDLRAGWRFKVGEGKTFDVYSELLNALQSPALSNPGTNRRTPASFLVLNGQQNLPASIQFGGRYGF